MKYRKITYPSPCKFNFFLDVLGRRPDGYHEVVTVIEPLGLFDTLHLTETGGEIQVVCDHPGVPGGEENIVQRAVRAIREETGTDKGASIRIEKRVPVAAGLGGGSANAAATLRALDDLWDLGLPPGTLARLAAGLGSDVPFFLDPRTSLCRGRGEKIEVLPPAPPFRAVLVNPSFPLSTRRAYESLAVTGPLREPHPNREKVIDALDRSDLIALGNSLYNVFQEVLEPRIRPLHELLDFFRRSRAVGTVLSGSGPTVIGLVETEEEGVALAAAARSAFPENYRVYLAGNTVSR
ncbi:MAG: 4-(cytidine 5'-diphospho)-2-C-methyl-D-erythritol kinase [PVC group bacterium]